MAEYSQMNKTYHHFLYPAPKMLTRMLDLPAEVIHRILGHLPLEYARIFLSHPVTNPIALYSIFKTIVIQTTQTTSGCKNCCPKVKSPPTLVMQDKVVMSQQQFMEILVPLKELEKIPGNQLGNETQMLLNKMFQTRMTNWDDLHISSVIMTLQAEDSAFIEYLTLNKTFLKVFNSKVSKLHLRINGLQDYPKLGFKNLRNLNSLLISHPSVETGTVIELPEEGLTDLDIVGSGFPEIIYQKFPDCIKRLGLAQNQLDVFDQAKVGWPKEMEALGLEGNYIHDITCLSNLPPTLQDLTLSYNNISNIPKTFSFPRTLRSLNLSANQLTSFPNLEQSDQIEELVLALNNLTSVGYLPLALKRMDLGDNQLTNIDSVKFPQGFEELLLAFNRISDIGNVQFPKSTTRISLCNNRLMNEFTGNAHASRSFEALHGLENLITLDLSHNNLSRVDFHNFAIPASVEGLLLDSCHLAHVHSIRLPQQLQVLDLQRNHITKISKIELPLRLRELYLNGNTIEDFDQIQVPATMERIGTPNFRIMNPQKFRIPDHITSLFR
ncbi:hypothetical protein BABINDRAFT_132831 [Babjeviella inositovora NRRL Y-12698]|uniref:F-box domain-containing protein n=1 Tax=Babjeviella inositovora NRRL Y-12698 TaxID=984486 RepID=A0A1E3QRP8_9ASCO|nr:uncharacterized protein BABINDRAFT_132831 [Babjeviella inositovora NRRL Y-12698]ODQ80373.1 hypothetical protein BABINDRAFT_132831 [Babjeviella inositovora NRRL Y-12698]